MAIPKKPLPTLKPTQTNDVNIRETREWRHFYEKYIDKAKSIKGSGEERKRIYCEKIDEITKQYFAKKNESSISEERIMEDASDALQKLRNTERWKSIYKRHLQSMEAMRGGKKDKEEAYLKMVDRLAMAPPVDQNNIMSGFSSFASPGFKWKSEE